MVDPYSNPSPATTKMLLRSYGICKVNQAERINETTRSESADSEVQPSDELLPPQTDAPKTANELIVQLARSLHSSGAPAYELEQRMEHAARTLGVPAMFFSTPTSLFVTFDHDSDYTRLLRVRPSETNLAKLAGLYDLLRKIEQGEQNVNQAWNGLRELETTNFDYGNIVNVVCYGVIAAGVAIFLGGNLTVVEIAGVIGVVVGVLVRSFERLELPGHLTNVVAGFVATTMANVAHFFVPTGNVELSLLAGLVILLPGLQITLGVNELATQNLASGTARMAGAMTTFLTMIFGVVMGYGTAEWFLPILPGTEPQPLGIGWSIAALVPIALTFCVLFRSRIRDIPWILFSTSIAFATVNIASIYLGPLAATWSAALAVGLFSNLFARVRNRPAAIMLMPGILLLVPGSLGFFGFSQIMVNDDMASGVKIVSTMMLVAVSIVAGILISDAVFPIEKRERKRKQLL